MHRENTGGTTLEISPSCFIMPPKGRFSVVHQKEVCVCKKHGEPTSFRTSSLPRALSSPVFLLYKWLFPSPAEVYLNQPTHDELSVRRRSHLQLALVVSLLPISHIRMCVRAFQKERKTHTHRAASILSLSRSCFV